MPMTADAVRLTTTAIKTRRLSSPRPPGVYNYSTPHTRPAARTLPAWFKMMGTGRGQSKELKAAHRGSLASPGSVPARATLQVIATVSAVCIRLANAPLPCVLHGRAIATSQKSNRTRLSVVIHADNPNILQAPSQTKKAPALLCIVPRSLWC